MKKKPVIHTLYIEDTLDIQNRKHIKCHMECEFDDHKVIHVSTSIIEDGGTTEVYIEKLKSMIRTADVITFDFGGFMQMAVFGASHQVVDYWNRFFVKLIENHPSKDWRCTSCLRTFEHEDREMLEGLGVHFVW